MSSSRKASATKGPKPKVSKKPKNPQFVSLYEAKSRDVEVLVAPESASAKRLRLFLGAAVLTAIEIDNNKIDRFVEGLAARDLLMLRLQLNDDERSVWEIKISIFPPGVYERNHPSYTCSIDVYRLGELKHASIDPMTDFLEKGELVEHGRLLDSLLGTELAKTFNSNAGKCNFVKHVCGELKRRITRAGAHLAADAISNSEVATAAVMTEKVAKFLVDCKISRRYS